MNAELVTCRLLAVLRTTSKTDKTKLLCLRKLLVLLRHASSREICTKFCFKSLDIFRSLLLTNCGLDCRDRTNIAPTIDLSCVCVTILCLREVCRSRLDVVNEGLRLALGEYNFLHLVTNLLLRSNFKPLHSAAIMLFLEMSEEVTIMREVDGFTKRDNDFVVQ